MARAQKDKISILVIRRDNIGDLVCTTPLLAALRKQFPQARICALVNSYNHAVLTSNPDVDEVYWYTKAKHTNSVWSQLGALWKRLLLIRHLRAQRFSHVVMATPGYAPRVVQLAGWLHAGAVIGYPGNTADRRITLPVHPDPADQHEAQAVFRLAQPLGITGQPPPARVVADTSTVQQLGLPASTYGIHISARKPSQRWPAERFVELIKALHAQEAEAQFLLFWSPGSQNNKQHPGDDEKAQQILQQLPGVPIRPCRTNGLDELIAGLSLCGRVICSDGGAMHLAAGLGKPIVALFGKSDAARWHPWGVPHVVLQPDSLDVQDIAVQSVLAAISRLGESHNSGKHD